MLSRLAVLSCRFAQLPLVCGLIATVLFAIAARRLLPSPWDALAVLLFGTSDMLIWHATEVKPYGSDAFIAMLLLLIALPLHSTETEDPETRREFCEWYAWRFAALSVVTAIAVWFSYAAIFVFAALSLAMLPSLWRKPASQARISDGQCPRGPLISLALHNGR